MSVTRKLRRVYQPACIKCRLCRLLGNGEDHYEIFSFSVKYGVPRLHRDDAYLCDACVAVIVLGAGAAPSE